MRALFILVLSGLTSLNSKSQSFAINSTGNPANSSSILDVSSITKGMLIPRVALSAKNNASPVSSPATSLLVYNTAVAGSGINAVTAGYYFWDGTQWVRIITDNNEAWSLNGNTGTTPLNHFIGTSDNVNLRIQTNNFPALFFKANSNFVGIGDEDPGENLVVRLNTRAVLPTPANYSGIQIKPTSAAGGSSNDYGFHFGLDNTLQRTARITNYEAGDLWFGFNDNDVLHLINGSRFVGVNEISPLDNLTIRLNPAGILPSPDPYSGLLIHSPTQAGFGNNFGLHIGLDNAFFRTARIMNNENEDLFLGTNKIEMIRLKGSNRFVGVNTSNPFHSFSVMVGANAIFTSPYDGLSVMTPNNPANSTSGLVVGSDPTFYPDKGIWNYDNGKIAFGTNNAERAVITDDGKLGIGTAFPTALLDINDNTIRVRTAKTPASSLDTGNTGDIAWDSNYIYVCIAANTWKRVGIATW